MIKELLNAYLSTTKFVDSPIERIVYTFPFGPQLPEWDEDYSHRVDTHGIKFSQGEALFTPHLTVCPPLVVRASDTSGLLHVAGGSISDITFPRYRGAPDVVHRQRTDLEAFRIANPDVRGLLVRSSGSNDWIKVARQLNDLDIPLDTIIDIDFQGARYDYDVAYRPETNKVLVRNPLAKEVWVFEGFTGL